MKAKSEYGKGMVTCLIYFAQHVGRLNDLWLIVADYEENKRLPEDWQEDLEIWHTFEGLLGSKIIGWVYAAQDHLGEIEIPKSVRWNTVRDKIKVFEELVYGCRVPLKLPTLDDYSSIIDLLNNIAIEIDKVIGLKPKIGRRQ